MNLADSIRYATATVLLALWALGAQARDAHFWVGVGTHFGQNRGAPERDVEQMARAGANAFRDEIFWSDVEVRKGRLEMPARTQKIERAIALARTAGIEPVIILCYGNRLYGGDFPIEPEARAGFVRYAGFLAAKLKGRVRIYEVWNEWNGGMGTDRRNTEGRKPRHYVRLLKDVHAAIKRADEGAIVLGGAVEGAGDLSWIEGMIDEGAAQYMDGLSIHPYMHHKRRQGTPENMLRWLERLEGRIAERTRGQALPLYMTEIGWPTTASGKGIPEDQCAQYLSRVFLLARTVASIRGVWWYELVNGGKDPKVEDQNFGILTADRTPKSAYSSFRDVAAVLSRSTSAELIARGDKVWAVRIGVADGPDVVAIWTPDGHARRVRLSARTPEEGKLTLSRIGDAGRVRDAVETRHPQTVLSLSIDGMPALLQGDGGRLEDLRIDPQD